MQQGTDPPSLGEEWSLDYADGEDAALPVWAAWRSMSRTPSLEKLLDQDFPPLLSFGSNWSRSSDSSGSVSDLPADTTGGQVALQEVLYMAPQSRRADNATDGSAPALNGQSQQLLRQTANGGRPVAPPSADQHAVMVVSSPVLYHPQRQQVSRPPWLASRLLAGSTEPCEEAAAGRWQGLAGLASRLSGLQARVHSVQTQLARLETQMPQKQQSGSESCSEEESQSGHQSEQSGCASDSRNHQASDDVHLPPLLPSRKTSSDTRLEAGTRGGPSPVYENIWRSEDAPLHDFQDVTSELASDSADSALSLTPPNILDVPLYPPAAMSALDYADAAHQSTPAAAVDNLSVPIDVQGAAAPLAASISSLSVTSTSSSQQSSLRDISCESWHRLDVSGTGDQGMEMQYAQPATVVEEGVRRKDQVSGCLWRNSSR